MDSVNNTKAESMDNNQKTLKDSKANENFENTNDTEGKERKCVENPETSSKHDNSFKVETRINTGTKNNQEKECKLENISTDMLPDNQYKGERPQKSLIYHSRCDENKTTDIKAEDTERRKVAVFEFDWALHIEEANKKQENDNEGNKDLEIAPVPSYVFMHVEASLDGGVREGMIVEMPYQDQHGTTQEEIKEQSSEQK